jgi:hypothetical protein
MNINDLKHALGTGANPSKFRIDITIPIVLRASSFINNIVQKIPLVGNTLNSGGATNVPKSDNISILCKATSLPEKSVSTIDIMHRGHKFTVRGVAQFPGRWTATFYNTADLNLRQFFEGWMYEMDRYNAILVPTSFPNDYLGFGSINSGYMTNLKINQLCSQGISAGYEFFYAFPIEVSSTELNSMTTNTVSEFTVTFAYSYWLPHTGTTLNDMLVI